MATKQPVPAPAPPPNPNPKPPSPSPTAESTASSPNGSGSASSAESLPLEERGGPPAQALLLDAPRGPSILLNPLNSQAPPESNGESSHLRQPSPARSESYFSERAEVASVISTPSRSSTSVSFAPLPAADRGPIRRASISLGVAARSSLLRNARVQRGPGGQLVRQWTPEEWAAYEQSLGPPPVDLGDFAVDAGKKLWRLCKKGMRRRNSSRTGSEAEKEREGGVVPPAADQLELAKGVERVGLQNEQVDEEDESALDVSEDDSSSVTSFTSHSRSRSTSTTSTSTAPSSPLPAYIQARKSRTPTSRTPQHFSPPPSTSQTPRPGSPSTPRRRPSPPPPPQSHSRQSSLKRRTSTGALFGEHPRRLTQSEERRHAPPRPDSTHEAHALGFDPRLSWLDGEEGKEEEEEGEEGEEGEEEEGWERERERWLGAGTGMWVEGERRRVGRPEGEAVGG